MTDPVVDDFYDLLKIGADAPLEQIENAYRQAVRYWHPDNFFGRDEKYVKQAESMTVRLNQAFEVLKDAGRRGLYDDLLEDWTAFKKSHFDQSLNETITIAGSTIGEIWLHGEHVRSLGNLVAGYSIPTDAAIGLSIRVSEGTQISRDLRSLRFLEAADLRSLSVDVDISPESVDIIGRLKSLRELILGDRVIGVSLQFLRELANLESLALGDSFEEECLPYVRSVPHLSHLGISPHLLTVTGVNHILSMPALRSLATGFPNAEQVAQLGRLTNVREMDISLDKSLADLFLEKVVRLLPDCEIYWTTFEDNSGMNPYKSTHETAQ